MLYILTFSLIEDLWVVPYDDILNWLVYTSDYETIYNIE
jgi:hypothetical protein